MEQHRMINPQIGRDGQENHKQRPPCEGMSDERRRTSFMGMKAREKKSASDGNRINPMARHDIHFARGKTHHQMKQHRIAHAPHREPQETTPPATPHSTREQRHKHRLHHILRPPRVGNDDGTRHQDIAQDVLAVQLDALAEEILDYRTPQRRPRIHPLCHLLVARVAHHRVQSHTEAQHQQRQQQQRHEKPTAEELAEAGIPEGLIRLAVGLEEGEEIIADLKQAFAKL